MSLTAHTAYLKEGKEAIRASGFPFEFIKEVQAVSQHGGPVISFRSGQPPSLNKGFPVSPKPMSIKTKTCIDAQGIPFLSGFIPDNQHLFGRKGAHCESNSEADFIRRRLSISFSEREKISTIPLQVRLQEILTGIDERQYEKINEDNEFLYFKVNLSPEQNAAFADPLLDKTQLEFKVKKNVSASDAERDDSAEILGELSYRTQPEMSFVPLTVISYEGAPVTGDADFLGVAVPLRAEFREACAASPAMFASYNTENMKELYLLFSQYVLLKSMIEKKKLNAKKIDQDTDFQKLLREHPGVQTAGVITPYELYVMLTVNAHMAELPEPLRRGRERLIRHGAENHNPGDPATLDSNMLHIINGSVLMTENEIQLRNFYLYAAVPEKYYFHVHPHWNIKIWAPLIARQIGLGLHDLMDPNTIRAYQLSAALKTIPVAIIDPVKLQITEKLSFVYKGNFFDLSLEERSADVVRNFLGIFSEEKQECFLTITAPLAYLRREHKNHLLKGAKRFFRYQLEMRENGIENVSRAGILRMAVIQENAGQEKDAYLRIMAHFNPDELPQQRGNNYFLMAVALIADIVARIDENEISSCEMSLFLTDFRIPLDFPAMIQKAAVEAGLQLRIHHGLYPQLKGQFGFSPALFGCVAGSSRADLLMQQEGSEVTPTLDYLGRSYA